MIHSQDGSTLLCYQHTNGKFHEIGGESFTPALTAVTIDRADPARICAVGNSEGTILVLTLTNTEEIPILSTVAMQTFESPVTSLPFENLSVTNGSFLFAGFRNGCVSRNPLTRSRET